ncbi:hypothetical protein CC1G_07842 [Coprinopsis cinerea okayama7|uniref:Uncharacterized protein n=1 Tax=Coprinopsis cinerea (strain Okayama-7 / 130 / ATCC MYA-4618 / FGSC 9003) TaxID=240176 RepID=A8P409_COPC7|nr:hypothetical protein CC1G_07842 [Coprinopsis cinerea okayama7\|eukprot:XP_001838651.2 hypothetical protein CC1G_07842 [Coprinopsis cinerea okayama7\
MCKIYYATFEVSPGESTTLTLPDSAHDICQSESCRGSMQHRQREPHNCWSVQPPCSKPLYVEVKPSVNEDELVAEFEDCVTNQRVLEA